jgi:hypothetical protein
VPTLVQRLAWAVCHELVEPSPGSVLDSGPYGHPDQGLVGRGPLNQSNRLHLLGNRWDRIAEPVGSLSPLDLAGEADQDCKEVGNRRGIWTLKAGYHRAWAVRLS